MVSEERIQFNLQYIDKMRQYVQGHDVRCNLDNPQTIQEKLMWLNIYDAEPIKSDCADKLKVKKYASKVLGKDIAVPTLKIWDNPDKINFDKLPDQFVLKCNHGSGMNIIVRDKNQMDLKNTISNLNYWLNDDFSMRNGFESHYHWIKRKIFAEQFIEIEGQNDIPDYKFLCFNEKPIYMQIMSDRHGPERRCNYYNMQMQKCTISRRDFCANYDAEDIFPTQFEQMKDYATKLANGFKFVRVDFYEVKGRVYIGEMTFTPGAFIFKYENPKDEIAVGGLLTL